MKLWKRQKQSMHKMVQWNKDLDLSEFYNEAGRRGFVNNASQKAMIDCFHNEREWNAWILYSDNKAIGSVAAHSFDDVMGPNSYRILTRVCTFGEARPHNGLVKANRLCAEHQNLTDQFMLPACLEWTKDKGRVFATSNKGIRFTRFPVFRFSYCKCNSISFSRKENCMAMFNFNINIL